jgi:hypothetical protein
MEVECQWTKTLSFRVAFGVIWKVGSCQMRGDSLVLQERAAELGPGLCGSLRNQAKIQ